VDDSKSASSYDWGDENAGDDFFSQMLTSDAKAKKKVGFLGTRMYETVILILKNDVDICTNLYFHLWCIAILLRISSSFLILTLCFSFSSRKVRLLLNQQQGLLFPRSHHLQITATRKNLKWKQKRQVDGQTGILTSGWIILQVSLSLKIIRCFIFTPLLWMSVH
jgi:hypothetical protein